MKGRDLTTTTELSTGELDVLEYRADWERTKLAHEVALRVISYRVEHQLTQTELARMLGMRQPHIARLEAGEHEPSLAMLARLARVLGLEFHIDITRSALRLSTQAGRSPVSPPGAVGRRTPANARHTLPAALSGHPDAIHHLSPERAKRKSQ